ncbi:MAG: PilX N-terminal domain-containing pilus assembly protein [bacterium]
MIKKKKITPEKGIALITSLLILSTLTLLGYIGIHTIVIDLEITGNVKDIKKSFYLAEAGISDALDFLDDNISNWNSYTNNYSIFTNEPLGTGTYSVIIDDIDASHDRRKIISTGTTASGTESKIMLIINPDYSSDSPFQKGLHGCSGVVLESGTTTSSYSSSSAYTTNSNGDVGTSDPSADIELNSFAVINGNVCATGELVMKSNAQVSKNVLANGDIFMESNSQVDLDARSSQTIYDGGTIGGNKEENVSPNVVPVTPCDPLDITTVFSEVSSRANNNADLNPGLFDGSGNFEADASHPHDPPVDIGVAGEEKHYSFKNCNITGGTSLRIQGDVEIYIDGDFTTNSNSDLIIASNSSLTIYITGSFTPDSNGTINNQGEPKDFTLFSTAVSSSATDYKVHFCSNTALYGVVYAPYAAIDMSSNILVYGALMGKYITMSSNTDFFYDEDLANEDFGAPPSTTPTGFTKVVWKQL